MKKIIMKLRVVLTIAMLVVMGVCFQNQVRKANAQYQGKRTWDRYTCNLITCKKDHHTIYFTGYGDDTTGTVYDAQFTGYNRHYPVVFTYGKTWTIQTSDAGYAYGNYTIGQSVITLGNLGVLDIRSKSATKSVTFLKK